jgi:hypothetical protein
MLSFPSALSTELRKGSTDLKYLIKLERRLIASPYTLSYLYYSGTDCTVYDNDAGVNVDVRGSLLSDITINEMMNIKNHTSSVGGFSIDLIDLGAANVSDFFTTYDIYNRPIEIWLITDTNTTVDGALLYSGLCGVPTHNSTTISLPIENSTYTVNTNLGESVISEADKVQRDVPPSSLGLVKPIIYGDRISNIGHTTPATNNFSKNTNFSKCIDMADDLNWSSGSIGTRTKNWYVARHECKSIDEVWTYDTDIKDFAKLSAFTTVQNDSNGCVISHTNRVDRYAYLYPSEVPSDRKVTVNGGTITNESNMVDMDSTTYGTIAAQDVSDVSEVKSAQIDVTFDNNAFYEKFENADITAIAVYVKTNYSHQGSSGNEEVDIIGYDGIFGSGPDYEIDIRSWTNDTLFNEQAFTTTTKSATQPTIRFRIKSGYGYGTFPTRELKIYGMFVRVTYTPLDDHDIYFGGKGRKDDGSGTITGSADSLIQYPSHIAEDIARNYMGLATAKIDTTAFDNVHTELTTSYKLATTINKSLDSKRFLENLGFQSKSIYSFNALNKLSADTFYASPTSDITGIALKDIASISFSKISLSDIVNKLYINYNYDAKKNTKQLSRSYDVSDTGSQDRYNTVSEKSIDASFISDDTTAGLLADHWCKDASDSFWSLPRNIIDCDFNGNDKDFMSLEISDVVEFDLDSYKKIYGESWSGKQFKITSIRKNLKNINIKAIEL